jgi:anti-anti-sigma regulatory factor
MLLPMFLATISKSRQLLVTRYLEDVQPEQLVRGREELRSLLAELSPGFTLLVDLSQLTSMHSNCAGQIGSFMEQFARAGIGHVVRVIPDGTKDIGFNILGAFHYPKELTVTNCETSKEAIPLLEA